MNKIELINKVKYNKLVYSVYSHCGSSLVKMIGLFVKRNPKMIVFSSFGGRKYDDSPRCIYEAMIKDPRFDNYRLIWALNDPDRFKIPRAVKVKCDTLSYFKALLSASIWITNSSMERGLSFKPTSILNINTWHGSAIKRMGGDIENGTDSFGSKPQKTHNDIMLAQSKYDVNIFTEALGIPVDNFRVIGLPRNDELIHKNTSEYRGHIKDELGIKDNRKIILYAPTYREYEKDEHCNCVLTPPINMLKWKEELGNEYILLFRAHYEVVKTMNIENDDFVINVSNYPNLNKLMIVSDLLVSDYSSIFFDYSILEKPMLCFAYDYDKYVSKRGVYFDIREKLNSYISVENELIENIQHLDYDIAVQKAIEFKHEFIENSGFASLQSVDIVWRYLNGNKY